MGAVARRAQALGLTPLAWSRNSRCCAYANILSFPKSIYGFTKENVRRPSDQVRVSRCVRRVRRARDRVRCGAIRPGRRALRDDPCCAASVRERQKRWRYQRESAGQLRLGVGSLWRRKAPERNARNASPQRATASSSVPPVNLVVRWGGRRRLSGFLPLQCAYADMYVVDTLWPDMQDTEFLAALAWYQQQDITMGG